MQNGVATYLTEEQVTAVKQKMRPTTKVVGAMTDLEAMETLAKAGGHFHARFEQEQMARIKAEQELAVARSLLTNRTAGLQTIQRIAEAGGLMLTNRDDLVSAYRGRR